LSRYGNGLAVIVGGFHVRRTHPTSKGFPASTSWRSTGDCYFHFDQQAVFLRILASGFATG